MIEPDELQSKPVGAPAPSWRADEGEAEPPAARGKPDPAAASFGRHRTLVLTAAAVIAAAVFAVDLLTPLRGAIAVLYITVVLLVAQFSERRSVLAAGICCTLLAAISFLANHRNDPIEEGALARFGVSLVAIAVTTLLSMRDRSARTTLAEQARTLELSHDTVIIRDGRNVIQYWNDGAERLYGWPREEALGKACDALLQCEVPSAEVSRALTEDGQWSGELTRVRRDGTRLVLASRWMLRRDPEGRSVGVIETSADLTALRRADAGRKASEQRYGAIFHAAGFATWESDWSGTRRCLLAAAGDGADLRAFLAGRPELVREAASLAIIRDANRAAADLFGASCPEELIGGNIVGRYTPEGEQSFAAVLAALAEGASMIETETRLVSFRGSVIDVVLRVTLLPEGEHWSRALVMALDVTERNGARARLDQLSAELAHAARISTLGQLAASIAHEVNQPLTAIITYGKSGKRWLSRAAPEIGEAANCLDQIVANGTRAADVISRVRSLARNAPPQAEPLDLGQLVDEAAAVVQTEARAAQVLMRRVPERDVPLVRADRVQVQQVMVNLLINAIQAMREVAGRPRELYIELDSEGDGMVRVKVRDCGIGISGDPARIFEPFFSTKADGMGMGLSICRSIIEAEGGRIGAANNPDYGATIAFTLPASTTEAKSGA